MKNIPQPNDTPYEAGDLVQIHLGEDDADAEFHGLICVVIDHFRDDLDSETGRDLDAFSYSLRPVESGDPLPIEFRHRDLVPANSQ